MIMSFVVTLLPAAFLVLLFGGGFLLRRRNINMDGTAPIAKLPFATSKYAIALLWITTVLYAWDVFVPLFRESVPLKYAAVVLWVLGFSLLFIGRLGMSDSFRIGSAKECTSLKTCGLFAISRNPMYVGVYLTLLASVLFTLNPVVLLVAVYIVVVHHKIILAEEVHLRQIFGQEYENYCRRVRRYL